jgi:hypothetical protein
MARVLVTAGSNDVRTKLIGPVRGCLPLKTSSGDDNEMVCGVLGMGMLIFFPILEIIMSWLM